MAFDCMAVVVLCLCFGWQTLVSTGHYEICMVLFDYYCRYLYLTICVWTFKLMWHICILVFTSNIGPVPSIQNKKLKSEFGWIIDETINIVYCWFNARVLEGCLLKLWVIVGELDIRLLQKGDRYHNIVWLLWLSQRLQYYN